MERTITVSETLYRRLNASVKARGLTTIEQLLEQWQLREDELRRREDIVRRIDNLRERIFQTYGVMEDSVDLVREDRGLGCESLA